MLSRLNTIWIPVSPTSENNQFPMPASLVGISDLLFELLNPNPFDIILEGTPAGGTFMTAAFPGSPWYAMARERLPVNISKQPVMFSVKAVDSPGNPLPLSGYDYSGCYVGLVYGRGPRVQ